MECIKGMCHHNCYEVLFITYLLLLTDINGTKHCHRTYVKLLGAFVLLVTQYLQLLGRFGSLKIVSTHELGDCWSAIVVAKSFPFLLSLNLWSLSSVFSDNFVVAQVAIYKYNVLRKVRNPESEIIKSKIPSIIMRD